MPTWRFQAADFKKIFFYIYFWRFILINLPVLSKTNFFFCTTLTMIFGFVEGSWGLSTSSGKKTYTVSSTPSSARVFSSRIEHEQYNPHVSDLRGGSKTSTWVTVFNISAYPHQWNSRSFARKMCHTRITTEIPVVVLETIKSAL